MTNTKNTPDTIGSWKKVFPYMFCFVGLGMSTSIVGPSLPWLAEQTNVSLSAIGFLFTARAVGYLTSSSFAGGLYDRKKSHPIMALALLAIAIAYYLINAAGSFLLLLLIFYLMGLFGSFVDIGGNVMTLQSSGANREMRVNALHFTFGIGTLLSPLLVAFAFDRFDALYIVYPLIGTFLLLALAVILFNPSPRVKRTDELPSTASLQDPRIQKFLFYIFVVVAAEVSFGAWVFTYAIESGILNSVQAGLLTSVFYGAFTFGRLLSIPISKVLDSDKLLPILFGIGLVFSLILLLSQSSAPIILWTCTLGCGLALSAAFPSSLSFVSKHVNMTGKFTSWIFIAANFAALSIPPLIGIGADKLGTRSILFSFVALFVVVNISFYLTKRSVEGQILLPK